MLILPLRFVRTEDKHLVGANLFNLARLSHFDFPVIESVIVIPPSEEFKKIIEKFKRLNTKLTDNLNNIKQAVSGIKIPDSLENFSVIQFSDSEKAVKVNTGLLWSNLLGKWSYELISKLERNEKDLYKFTPQLVIFSANFTAYGRGYFDEDRDHVVIKVDKGNLDFSKSQEIENLIILGNKKLMLPQVYYWVIEEGKIKLIKLSPFTQSLPERDEEIGNTVEVKPKVRVVKTATKIFLDYKDGVLSDLNCDGVLLRIEKTSPDAIDLKLNKVLNFQKNLKVIFYPDYPRGEGKDLDFAKSFLFFRNKKKIDASVVLPSTDSVDSFLKMKTDFASLGIYSKGTLKIWKEFKTAADFLLMDQYIDAGFDGAVLNLDWIGKMVTGVEPEEIKSSPKLDWLKSMELFMKELNFLKLTKQNKQVLLAGILAENEELLGYFIKSGVWGAAFKQNVLNAFREHIGFLESLTMKKLHHVKIDN
jgi:hypothetical protein